MKASFWIHGNYRFQITTGLIHSMSLFIEQQPASEKEKQLLDIMQGYQMDMGASIHRSMVACFTQKKLTPMH
jgi:hypothetical protein